MDWQPARRVKKNEQRRTRALVSRRLFTVMRLKPFHRFSNPLFERSLRRKPEEIAGARSVETSPWLTIRPATVPFEFALIAGRLAYHFSQLADRDLAAGAQVDRFRAVILFSGK